MAAAGKSNQTTASDLSDCLEPDPSLTQRRRTKWRRVRWIIRVGVIFGAIGWLGMFGCDSLFYHPDQRIYYRPVDFQLDHEEVHFQTTDGLTLHGWFIPAKRSVPRGTVIHFHGNAANITNHIASVAWLPWEGYQLLLFDYRGYGKSEGKITRKGSIIDSHAALDYILSRPDVDPNTIFAYGQSLGGAIAAYVAAERKEIRAVVIESSFPSYRAIAARHALKFTMIGLFAKPIAWWLISEGYDPIDVIADIAPRPVLVIVCTDDPICPPDLGRQLYDQAGEPREFIEVDASHYQAVDMGGQEVISAIIATFESGTANRMAGR